MSFGVYNQVIFEFFLTFLFLLIPIVIYRKDIQWKWIGILAALFLVHKMVLFFGVAGIYPDIIGGRYNWEGKLAAIVLLLLAAWFLFPKENDAWGFRLSQHGDHRKAGFWVAAFTLFLSTGLAWLYFSGTKTGAVSDWLYQISMPGIEEELLDRGIMLLIIDRAIPKKWKFAAVHWSWGAVVLTIMFYMTHVARVDDAWNITVLWGDFLPGIYGLLLMYVRLATGSLALPILLHGWINGIGYLI